MKKHVRTAEQIKIAESMAKVYEKLIEYKKKINSDLVISRDGKIVKISASEL